MRIPFIALQQIGLYVYFQNTTACMDYSTRKAVCSAVVVYHSQRVRGDPVDRVKGGSM